MTSATFRGGPVAGLSFHGLNRTPTFVRVVFGKTYDVLNDLDDEVRDDEQVVAVYVLDSDSRVHVCARGAGGASGWYVTYVFLPIADVASARTEEEWCALVARIVGVPAQVALEQRADERAGATPQERTT